MYSKFIPVILFIFFSLVGAVLGKPIENEEQIIEDYSETTDSIESNENQLLTLKIDDLNMYINSMAEVMEDGTPYIEEISLQQKHTLAKYQALTDFVFEGSDLTDDFTFIKNKLTLESPIEEQFITMKMFNDAEKTEPKPVPEPEFSFLTFLHKIFSGLTFSY